MTEGTEVEIEKLKRLYSDKDQFELRAQRLSSLLSRLNEKDIVFGSQDL